MSQISVIIIDGERSDSFDCASILSKDMGILITARSSLVEETDTLCAAHSPDVLLLSVNCLRDLNPKWLAGMQQRHTNTRILLIGRTLPDGALLDCLGKGARGHVTHDSTSPINKALYAVNQGEAWISRKMARCVIDHIVAGKRTEMHTPSQL